MESKRKMFRAEHAKRIRERLDATYDPDATERAEHVRKNDGSASLDYVPRNLFHILIVDEWANVEVKKPTKKQRGNKKEKADDEEKDEPGLRKMVQGHVCVEDSEEWNTLTVDALVDSFFVGNVRPAFVEVSVPGCGDEVFLTQQCTVPPGFYIRNGMVAVERAERQLHKFMVEEEGIVSSALALPKARTQWDSEEPTLKQFTQGCVLPVLDYSSHYADFVNSGASFVFVANVSAAYPADTVVEMRPVDLAGGIGSSDAVKFFRKDAGGGLTFVDPRQVVQTTPEDFLNLFWRSGVCQDTSENIIWNPVIDSKKAKAKALKLYEMRYDPNQLIKMERDLKNSRVGASAVDAAAPAPNSLKKSHLAASVHGAHMNPTAPAPDSKTRKAVDEVTAEAVRTGEYNDSSFMNELVDPNNENPLGESWMDISMLSAINNSLPGSAIKLRAGKDAKGKGKEWLLS
ncbi:unnamed protein product [Amoebophrya sp. A25]|nr:unnamed protein product [Amoebophrya sp. A25]|eukprot:GSA25T00027790001.1